MDDPQLIYMRPYVPGMVLVPTRIFVALCLLSAIGTLTIFLMVFA
jgi:hypothetical protein